MGDIDLVRPLGLAGIPCAVFSPWDAPAHRSRHTRARVPWADPWGEPEEAVEKLVAFGREQPRRPVLLPESDGNLLLVSRHREELAACFDFFLADAELVEILADKLRFSELAARLGLPVPRSQVLRPGAGRPQDVDLRFPLVVKPANRWGGAWTGMRHAAKARRVDTPAELAALWPRMAELDLEVLAQEAVPGPETRIESHHAYVDRDGAVVGQFTGRKIRTRPAEYGDSTALVVTDAPDVAALGTEVLESTGVRGMVKTDFKRGPDGELALLEVNPRCTLWHHLAARAGLNLPALLYADVTGRPRPPGRRARPGARWCDPLPDLQAVREAGGSPRAWARWAAGCDAVSGWAWDDPLPFLAGTLLPTVRGRAARAVRARRR